MAKHQHLKIICDAACRVPNAHIRGGSRLGKSACGAVFIDITGVVIDQISDYLGELTSPQAEYTGLIKALDHAASLCRKSVEVWMDSELVIRQLNGEYAIRSQNMKPLFDQVKVLEKRFSGPIKYFHHSREARLAKCADKLANDHLDKQFAP